jgi:hypothetical protein
MNETVPFRARLRVRLGKPLTSDSLALVLRIGGREIEIKSQNKDELLRNAKWVVFSSGGFLSATEAQAFGEALRTIVGIVGISARLGIDVGEDKATTWINEEFARSLGLIKSNERVHPNVHGLIVHPDDGLSRFPAGNFEAVATSSPTQLIDAAESFVSELPQGLSAAETGVRLLNRALMSAEPLTQVVLAISVVEALGQNEEWSESQKFILNGLAESLESSDHTDEENKEIGDALRRSVHRISLRQGVLRVLTKLQLEHLKKEWDRLYGMRSGVFHGTAHLSEPEISKLAQDCLTLCGRIVIELLKQEGIHVPPVAEIHYPTEVSRP